MTTPFPHNQESEELILGAVLLDNAAMPQVAESLSAEDFFSPTNRRIFAAMLTLFEKQQRIDPVLIGNELRKDNSLESIGGVSVITNLTTGIPPFTDLTEYIDIVREKKQLRDIIKAGGEIQRAALDEGADADAIINYTQSLINSVCMRNAQDGFVLIGEESNAEVDKVEKLYRRVTQISGVPTGFLDFDRLLNGGLQKTDLTIIGGRPAQGKSALLGQIAMNVTLKDPEAIVAVFSLEMSRQQYVQRLLCSRAEVDLGRARRGDISGAELDRMRRAMQDFSQLGVLIDDSSVLTAMQMRSKLLMVKQKYGRLDLACVDYLQRMQGRGRSESRRIEVGTFARDLKTIAKDLDVPVVALSALRRLSGNDPRPSMSDLLESGDVESEASMVALLHRPNYYDASQDPTLAELIVDKNRHGPCDTLKLSFMREYTKFGERYERY